MSTRVELGQRHETAVLDSWRWFAALPDWLSAVARPIRVHSALVRGIREFASGELTLQGCTIRRVRIKQDHWTAMYQLTVDGPSREQRRVVTIRGTLIPPGRAEPDQAAESAAFGTEAWHCYLPELRLELQMGPSETELEALSILIDPNEARALLEQGIRAGAPAYRDIRIHVCTPKVMRYKPGSRCTVLYHLEYPADLTANRDWPDIVVAKTYHGDKGQNAYDGMSALWISSLATSNAVSIAEPLAYLPEMNVLIQGPVREEQTLKELIRSALCTGTPEAMQQVFDTLRKTAVGLVALHRSEVRVGNARVWEDELAEVRDIVDRLAGGIRWLAGAATPLLERLEALAAEYPAGPPVPSHGSFRPAQVLLNKGQIGFIDFDGFCQAEPALDLALFLAKIKDIGMNTSMADEDDEDDQSLDWEACLARLVQMEAICEAFLAEYEALLPVSRQRVALWEALDIFTLVLHSWTKVKPVRLKNSMLLLERHLHASGLRLA